MENTPRELKIVVSDKLTDKFVNRGDLLNTLTGLVVCFVHTHTISTEKIG